MQALIVSGQINGVGNLSSYHVCRQKIMISGFVVAFVKYVCTCTCTYLCNRVILAGHIFFAEARISSILKSARLFPPRILVPDRDGRTWLLAASTFGC